MKKDYLSKEIERRLENKQSQHIKLYGWGYNSRGKGVISTGRNIGLGASAVDVTPREVKIKVNAIGLPADKELLVSMMNNACDVL